MNLWHDISPGKNTPDELNAIIEIPKGSKNKYEIDKDTGLIKLDRPAHTAQDFPFDYGFVPQTYWHDDDPLDVIILTTYPLLPNVLVEVRPVGLLEMIDDGDNDNKIIAVPAEDPRFSHVKDIGDVNQHTLKEMEHFYATYKKLQNKEVSVSGCKDAKAAKAAITESLKLYDEKFSGKKQ